MAKIQIPCLTSKPNRDGTLRWYWQPSATLKKAGWKPIALGKDKDEAIKAAQARNAEVEQWKLGGAKPAQVKRRQMNGTVSALIERYRREVLDAKGPDGNWAIARSTRKVYETSLKRLDVWAGKHPIEYVTRARVRKLRDTLLKPADQGGIGHHAAFAMLRYGRVLFKFAKDCDLISSNPFEAFGLGAPAPRAVIWSAPAREYVTAAAEAAGKPSIALACLLGFSIGQREQDILALTASKYVAIPEHKMQPEDFATLARLAPDGVPRGIRVRQMKTRAWVEVPVVGETRRRIEANIKRAKAADRLTIILDDGREEAGRVAIYAGEAGQTRFIRDFAVIREAAAERAEADGELELADEIRTLQFRDLRRTCVVYLGELGMDAHLIAGVTGHDIDETQEILKVYMPMTTGRASRAIALASVRDEKDRAARKEQEA